MQTKEELFKDNGWARLHDVMVEAVIEVNPALKNDETFTGFSEKDVSETWDCLPEHIRDIAHRWSIGDTVFGDEAYTWLVEQLRMAE